MTRPFTQVDVFTDEPYRDNPLAVVHDADGLSTDGTIWVGGGAVTCVAGTVEL